MKNYTLIFLFSFFPVLLFAVCSESNAIGIQTTNPSLKIGQSFTLDICSSGNMQSIQVNSTTNNTDVTLVIYQGSGFGGSVLHTQTGVNLNIGINTIALSANVPFMNGVTYTFSLEVNGGFLALLQNSTSVDLYTNGTLFDNSGLSILLDDLVFTIGTDANLLPVELGYFEVKEIDSKAILKWQTLAEVNNAGFQIEKSKDAIAWTNIGFVEGQGSTNEIQTYQFIDPSPFQETYYRLIQIDYDGKIDYSPTIHLSSNLSKTFECYPNPITAGNTLNLKITPTAYHQYSLVSVLGQRVLINSLDSDNLSIPIPNHLPKGNYFLVLEGDHQRAIQKLKID